MQPRITNDEIQQMRLHLEAGPFCPDGIFTYEEMSEVFDYIVIRMTRNIRRFTRRPRCSIVASITGVRIGEDEHFHDRVVVVLEPYSQEQIDLIRYHVLDSPMVIFRPRFIFTYEPETDILGDY